MCDRIDILRRIKELEKENKVLKEELKCTEINFQICNADLAALGELVGGSCFDETYDLVKQLVDKATPKKPDQIYKRCSCCCHKVGWNYYADRKLEHCPNCGQKLDWSDNNT